MDYFFFVGLMPFGEGRFVSDVIGFRLELAIAKRLSLV
jgi:hypothetical protein